jgi:hypothetical protein
MELCDGIQRMREISPLTIIRKQGSQVNREELALASVFFQDDSQRLAEVARAA